MAGSACTASTPVVSSELSVTAELSASGSPPPAPIGAPKTPPSSKILASAPAPARGRTHSFIGVVPPKPWGRGKSPTGWGLLGDPYLPFCCLEEIWLWNLGTFITLFQGFGRQLFGFRRWQGFLYRPSTAGWGPCFLWRDPTTTAARARAPAGLSTALSARWRGALTSNYSGRLSAGFWPCQLWSLLLGGFLLRWGSLYFGGFIIAWGPRERTGPCGSWFIQREARDRGPTGSILRKARITGQIGWWGRYWRGLAPHPLVILISCLAQWGGKWAGVSGCGGEDISYPGQLWIHWWGAPIPQQGRCMALEWL